MAGPSLQDFISGFDPTGQNQIQGSDLLNMVQGGTPNTDKGLILTTTDVNGVPQVPNPNAALANNKWQNYFWRRVLTNGGGVVIGVLTYQWNPAKAVDATLLYWDQLVTIASLGSISSNGRILQIVETVDTASVAFLHGDTFGLNGTVAPLNNTGKQLGGLATAFNPISSTSKIFVEVTLPFAVNVIASGGNLAGQMVAGLFSSVAANPNSAVAISSWGFQYPNQSLLLMETVTIRYSYQNNSTVPVAFSVFAGWNTDFYAGAGPLNVGAYNSGINTGTAALQTYLGGIGGRLKITEYL